MNQRDVIVVIVGGTLVFLALVFTLIVLVVHHRKQFIKGVKWATDQHIERIDVGIAIIRLRLQISTQTRANSATPYDIHTLQYVIKMLEDVKGAEPNTSP